MKFLNKIPLIKGSLCRGVHISFTSNEDFDYAVADIKKAKNEINIIKRFDGTSSINNEPEFLFTDKLPVIISIDGKGVLHKKASLADGNDSDEIISNIFPNIQSDNVYYQVVDAYDSSVIVSVIRKENCDFLNKQIEKGLIYEILVGPFSLKNLINVIEKSNDEKLVAGGYELSFKSDEIINISRTSELKTSFKVANEIIEEKYLIPYSNAINYFIDKEINKSILQDINIKSEFLAGRAFKKLGIVSISFFFLLLLLNFLVFDHYNKKQSTLSVLCVENENLLQALTQLETDLQQKKEFVEKSGILRGTGSAIFFDYIAGTVPPEITLTSMNINPLSGKLKKDEKPSFDFGVIDISGQTSSGESLNVWISQIKEFDWVTEISITEFEQNDFQSEGYFKLKITF
ncbi:MAG: hypothetical protein PHE56_00595 [Bacteroidales bacterium]|nr:hypothetical protein [Bacteroidales bacterium]